ncbi:MAG: hypothetical protein ACRCV9_10610, partial [Burkholderiaceae bacterium]
MAAAPVHAQGVPQAAPSHVDEQSPAMGTAPLPWRLKQIAQARTAATTEAPLPKPQTSLPTLGAPETQDL